MACHIAKSDVSISHLFCEIPWKNCKLSVTAVLVDAIPVVVNVAIPSKPELLLFVPTVHIAKF